MSLSTVEKVKGGRVIAVIARKHKHKPKVHKKTVGVVSATATIPVGETVTVKVSLNGTGDRLLKRWHTLPAKLVIVQGTTTIATHTVSFKYHKPHKKHHKKH